MVCNIILYDLTREESARERETLELLYRELQPLESPDMGSCDSDVYDITPR